MNSETVYQVAKALPREEQFLLFKRLKKDFIVIKSHSERRKKLLTKEEAFQYLLLNIFNKKKKQY